MGTWSTETNMRYKVQVSFFCVIICKSLKYKPHKIMLVGVMMMKMIMVVVEALSTNLLRWVKQMVRRRSPFCKWVHTARLFLWDKKHALILTCLPHYWDIVLTIPDETSRQSVAEKSSIHSLFACVFLEVCIVCSSLHLIRAQLIHHKAIVHESNW